MLILCNFISNYRGSSNDQLGYYDYSFNNNYLLFQNPPPSGYNSYDYTSSTSYPDYNSFPPSYSSNSQSSSVLGSSYRHSSASNFANSNDSKSLAVKNESQNDDLEKLQSIVHVQHVDQHNSENSAIINKEDNSRKEFDKTLGSEWLFLLMSQCFKYFNFISIILRRCQSRHIVLIMRQIRKNQVEEETKNPFLAITSCRARTTLQTAKISFST